MLDAIDHSGILGLMDVGCWIWRLCFWGFRKEFNVLECVILYHISQNVAFLLSVGVRGFVWRGVWRGGTVIMLYAGLSSHRFFSVLWYKWSMLRLESRRNSFHVNLSSLCRAKGRTQNECVFATWTFFSVEWLKLMSDCPTDLMPDIFHFKGAVLKTI